MNTRTDRLTICAQARLCTTRWPPGPAGWLASLAEHRARESRSSFVVMRRPEPDRRLRCRHRGPGVSALRPGLWVSWNCDVAPRWIEPKDRFGTLQSAHEDWLLVSGEFVVGRVLQDRAGPQAGRCSWSLTEPLGSSIDNQGIAETFEGAPDALLASWRRMAAMGGGAG